MKVIHVMTRNLEKEHDNVRLGLTSSLVSFLSALKWKSFGFTTKIYVDSFYKDLFTQNGLLDLYDEVDDTLFVEKDLYKEHCIDKQTFWAFSKLFVYTNENEPFILTDMDLIPLKDYHNIIDESKNYIYYNESFKNNQELYPGSDLLATAEGYEFPEWLTWTIFPTNAAVVYLGNSELKELYIEEAIRYAKNNIAPEGTEFKSRMVFAEQRLLPECANYLGLTLEEIKSKYEMIFNPRELHLSIFKDIDDGSRNPHNWIMFFLEKLNKEFPDEYNKIIEWETLKEYKNEIETNGFDYQVPTMLKRTKW